MSIEQVKSAIEKFVENQRNDFFIIKGGWGVGKTYFWQNLVTYKKEQQELGFRNYAYVSLFGINDIESLKNAITASFLESKVEDKTSFLAKWLPFAFNQETQKHTQKIVENIPYVGWLPIGLVGVLAFLSVKDALICFDDIERKGSTLGAKYILGLASLLKEQRNCKIVFILNEEHLKSEKEEFSIQNEKVVDREFSFVTSAENAFEYIFKNTHPYYELLKVCCLTLEIKNIRILKRIRDFVEDIIPYLSNLKGEVADDVIRCLTLFVWSFYDKESNPPPLEFLKKYNYYKFAYNFGKDDKEITPETEKWNLLLQKYKFGYSDELDLQLISFLENGYVNDELLKNKLNIKNEKLIAQKGRDSYSEAWAEYRDSFDCNEEEICKKLADSFLQNIDYLSLSDLLDTVSFLREFKKNDSANELVDKYVEKRITLEKLLEMKKEKFHEWQIPDEYLDKKFNEIFATEKKSYDFDSLLEKAALTENYTRDEIQFLASHSVSRYLDFFKSAKTDKLYSLIKGCVQIGNYNNYSPYLDVAKKTIESMRLIADECHINKIRVTNYHRIQLQNTLDEQS